MGDNARFRLFAGLLSLHFPSRDLRIADVASGRARLKGRLREMGYGRVTCWDRRYKTAAPRPGRHSQDFDYRLAPDSYQLVAGLHPDEASDHIILYAARHRVPFILCPCCIKPSAAEYGGRPGSFQDWDRHLVNLARKHRMKVFATRLQMEGRNVVMIGWPAP